MSDTQPVSDAWHQGGQIPVQGDGPKMSKTDNFKLKPVDYRLISELIENPRLSDRQIARHVGISQPTVSRRILDLEKGGLLDCTSIPDMAKLDFEIMAVTFGTLRVEGVDEWSIKDGNDFLKDHPNVIYVSTGRGLSFNMIFISLHKSYSDYRSFLGELGKQQQPFTGEHKSFMISLKYDNILRDLTFKHLARQIEKEHSS